MHVRRFPLRRATLSLLALGLLPAFLMMAGCGPKDPAADYAGYTRSANPRVYVSTPVLAAFTRAIVGDAGEVIAFIPGDADPATWTPTKDLIRTIQRGDRIVLQGAAYEEWAERISLPSQRTVRTADAVRDAWIRYRTVRSHSHGDGEVHEHDGVDGHTWLDPQLALKQAVRIAESLKRGWPEHAETYEAGLAALTRDLSALDARMAKLPKLPGGQSVHASQPVFGYLAERLGWPLVDHDLAVDAAVDGYLIEPLKLALTRAPASWLLWHAAPRAEVVAGLAKELNLRSVTLDPCIVGTADQGPILARMARNLDTLESLLGE